MMVQVLPGTLMVICSSEQLLLMLIPQPLVLDLHWQVVTCILALRMDSKAQTLHAPTHQVLLHRWLLTRLLALSSQLQPFRKLQILMLLLLLEALIHCNTLFLVLIVFSQHKLAPITTVPLFAGDKSSLMQQKLQSGKYGSTCSSRPLINLLKKLMSKQLMDSVITQVMQLIWVS